MRRRKYRMIRAMTVVYEGEPVFEQVFHSESNVIVPRIGERVRIPSKKTPYSPHVAEVLYNFEDHTVTVTLETIKLKGVK
jgi:hypothetical protein